MPRRRRIEEPGEETAGRIRPPQLKHNEHRKTLEKHFGPLKHEPAALPPDVKYVFLCFLNRTGSNYLAELLSSSGQYNRPTEILNHPAVLKISNNRAFTRFQDFFAHLARRQQQGGYFFVKAALHHIDILARTGVLDQVVDSSQFVMIERNDVLGQAISFPIAIATRAFSSEAEGSAKPQDVEYSRESIDRHIDAIAQSREEFALFFGRNGIAPIRMTYERLIADPEGEVSWLARELGLPDFCVDMSNVRLARQAGPVNEAWRRRYLSEPG